MSRRHTHQPSSSSSLFEPETFICNGMEERDVMIYKEIFSLLDPINSSEITPNELRMGLQSINIGVTKSDLYNLICDYDQNESGKIDFREFMMAMNGTNRPCDHDKRADYLRIFKKIAGSKDRINKEDILNHSRSTGRALSEEEIKRVFDKYECINGEITFEQYHKAMTDYVYGENYIMPESIEDCGKSMTVRSGLYSRRASYKVTFSRGNSPSSDSK